jgi:hypothetical protein
MPLVVCPIRFYMFPSRRGPFLLVVECLADRDALGRQHIVSHICISKHCFIRLQWRPPQFAALLLGRSDPFSMPEVPEYLIYLDWVLPEPGECTGNCAIGDEMVRSFGPGWISPAT